jgi:pilus assembly protein Flp/PilA
MKLSQPFSTISHFFEAEEAVTAIEYALLAALITVAIVGSIGVLGLATGGIYSAVSDALAAAINSSL